MTLELTYENVSAARAGITIFSSFTDAVTGGEALVLRGPNGVGKTTLIRMTAGFLMPAAGRIDLSERSDVADLGVADRRANDDKPGDDEPSVGEQAHFVGHANGLKTSLTVRENLAFWQRYLGGNTDDVTHALSAFHLEPLADIPAGLLSAGQKRRTGLARLFVAPRPLWLLDEPTTSLDAASSRLVADAINAHLAAGGLAVIATHLPLDIAPVRQREMVAHGADAE